MTKRNDNDGLRESQARGEQAKDRPAHSRSRRRPNRGPYHSRKPANKALAVTAKGRTRHLMASLEEGSYIAFDIETTGGNPERNGITEIFAVRYVRGEPRDTFYSMVNPKISIPPIVRRMTGITNRMVKDAPPIEAVMPRFVEVARDDVLVSHNTIGDMKFLRYFAAQTTGETLANYFLCTHLLVEKLAPEAPDKSLKGLSEHFKLPCSGELHRAEADAYLTLELFKVLLTKLATRQVRTIAEAIRFQGDYESGLRLGWGVSQASLDALPQGPGVFYLLDHEEKVTFVASADNVAREARKLQRFGSLPRQLLKAVLPSTGIKGVPDDDPFSASLREAEDVVRYDIRFDPIFWHQRTANFLFTVDEGDGVRVLAGNLEPGATAVLGPIRGGKEVSLFLEDLARIFCQKCGRKGVRVDSEAGRLVRDLLLGRLEQRSASLLSLPLLALPYFRKKFQAEQALRAKLCALEVPKGLEPLTACSGVLALPNGAGWRLCGLQNGLPCGSVAVQADPDQALREDAEAKRLVRKVTGHKKNGRQWKLGAEEAAMVNRTAWWAFFGAKRHNGRFYGAGEI